MGDLEVLLAIALDLTSSLAARDRYDRLLGALRQAIPYDAAALLKLDTDRLVPLAARGLSPEALGRRYRRGEHPRFDAILAAERPVWFAAGSPLPDPFDGLLATGASGQAPARAGLGCPLLESGEVVGVLAADAAEPSTFDGLGAQLLTALGALAGAALRSTALIETCEQLAEHQGLVARELAREASRRGGELIGVSPAIERVRREIAAAAPADTAVLILGETGVGKALVAQALHDASPRRDKPVIQVSCAALPESAADTELFGRALGASDGASVERAGLFEVACGGTLLLDEVGELPLSVQPKLLRALRTGEIRRVGSDRPIAVDVRVLATTNRNLEREVAIGRFRHDLYRRLSARSLVVPPLRERRDDVPVLAAHFLGRYRRTLGLGSVRLTEAARRRLATAPWPGNVRELEHLLGRALLHAGAAPGSRHSVTVDQTDLGLEPDPAPPPSTPFPWPGFSEGTTLRKAVDEFKRELIIATVDDQHGNWAAAARVLGLHRSNLHHLARRLGLR